MKSNEYQMRASGSRWPVVSARAGTAPALAGEACRGKVRGVA